MGSFFSSEKELQQQNDSVVERVKSDDWIPLSDKGEGGWGWNPNVYNGGKRKKKKTTKKRKTKSRKN
jgi:hypothetical protein